MVLRFGRRVAPVVSALGIFSGSGVLATGARAACATSANNATLVTMGEAMLRLAPIDDGHNVVKASRHMPQPFLRSIGGDELSVAVALSLLEVPTRWVSVVPTGPMGDVLTDSCEHHGVEFSGSRVDGEIGMFTVLPEEQKVHYQRRNSVFARHEPATLDWPALLNAPSPWLHMTGITPLISPQSRASWDAAIEHAARMRMPISLDLNHRKQLGTLEELWAMVQPHSERLELLILSVEQLNGLARLELGDEAPPALDGADEADAPYLALMARLQVRWGCARVALCRKVRGAGGVQRRWSLMTTRAGLLAAGARVLEKNDVIGRVPPSTARLPASRAASFLPRSR